MKAYCNMNYLSRERWISFWYQMMEVNGFSPKSVLEIGPGPGIVMEILESMGIKTTTLDIDKSTKPNLVGNVIKLPLKDKTFDVVLAAEILEHIPFSDFADTLREITRVARKGVVITLPHFHQFAPAFSFKIFPFVPRIFKVFPITWKVRHKFDGQHFWEIGKKGYSINRIRSVLKGLKGFRLIRDYLIEENPYHHVFVLRRSESEMVRPNDANNKRE